MGEKVTPVPSQREKITPERAKALARLDKTSLAPMLEVILKENPALFSLLAAVPIAEPKPKKVKSKRARP